MNEWNFKAAFINNQWQESICIHTDEKGVITKINSATAKTSDVLIPGFQNAHSHAFQFAMTGLAEKSSGDDDFWSWRESMYQIANNIDPDCMHAVACMLYAQMLRNGYTHVTEFHYFASRYKR